MFMPFVDLYFACANLVIIFFLYKINKSLNAQNNRIVQNGENTLQ